jgi:hypothetical protein
LLVLNYRYFLKNAVCMQEGIVGNTNRATAATNIRRLLFVSQKSEGLTKFCRRSNNVKKAAGETIQKSSIESGTRELSLCEIQA